MNRLVKQVSGAILLAILAFSANANNLDHLTPAQKTQYAKERKEYSTICKTADPKTGNRCDDEKTTLRRMKQCLSLREAFSKKWFNDNDVGHKTEINNLKKGVENKEKWIKANCK